MTRAELRRWFVLTSICDDYEDIEQITKSVNRFAASGVATSASQIIEALEQLIAMGHATAWQLGSQPPIAYAGMPPPEAIKPWGAYFYTTPRGLEAQNLNDW